MLFQRHMVEHWQDLVFTFGTVVFTVALIPALKQKMYPPKSTCFITAAMLVLYTVTEVTMDLWLSAATTLMSTIMWFILGVIQLGNRDN